MKIEVRNGNVERALRKLKKKMFDGGTIKELSDRRYFTKPSEVKRLKKKEAIRLNQRAIKKEQLKQLQHKR